jgi:serine/threonine protein kinase
MNKLTRLCPYCGEEIKSVAIKCKHCGSLLTKEGSASPAGIDLVKQALGSRYEIIEEIGHGGMANVYKAVQINLDRPVALKVIHQNLLHDSGFIARFHREAKLCASLSHPNIVTIHDEGEVSGVHFMAMEYLHGQDLQHLIKSKGRLNVDEALQYFLPLSDALKFSHHRGLIHRDIKSSNIFITSAGRVVLLDFGIAHTAGGTLYTKDGKIFGTPEYMSPEQAEGKTIDHRTDIYSLGIVLYECLTGKVPFKSENPLSTIAKLVNETPVPPVKINNLIPSRLNSAVLKAISKNPEDRFADAADFALALSDNKQWKTDSTTSSSDRNTRIKKSNENSRQKVMPKQPLPETLAKKTKVVAHKVSIKTKVRSNYFFKIALLIALASLLVSGSFWVYNYYEVQAAMKKERSYFERAGNTKTIAALEEYLAAYPNGQFAGEAKNKIQEIIEEQNRKDPFHKQMVFVKGGAYRMGCTGEQGSDCDDKEKPAHQVTVSDFYIGRYEVTQKQWQEIMGYNPSYFKNCDTCPVENVSWNDVQEFFKELNQKTGKRYRLPTEAEWEYAARGGASIGSGTATKYSGSNNIKEVAWCAVNSGGKTNPVGKMKANELGLYDMSGNVWEWCEDDWHKGLNDTPNNGKAFIDNPRGDVRITRGGSVLSSADSCNVISRSGSYPGNRSIETGFRLARSEDYF